jgi:hypothetical protein
MPREPDGYREQLEHLAERYPGKEVLTIQEICAMFGCHRQTLLADPTFPAKRIGNKGKYYIPVVGLARWMMTR